MIEKNKLRSNLKNLDYKDFALSEINIKFLNSLIHQKKVCTYIPNKMEININKYLVNFLELQTTYLDDEMLNICLLNEPFVENKYKIAEPAIKIPVTDTQVFLIPGLGFTKEGIRLGRGKGLYDKLLSKYSTALSALKAPYLPPIDQNTMRFYNRVSIYNEYGGMGFEEESKKMDNA